jgi:hypothetical protein
MKKKIMLATLAVIFSAMAWTACQKDKISNPNSPISNIGVTDRDGGGGNEGGTLEAVPQSLKDEVTGFKAQLDGWRKGQNLSSSMSATLATYNMESVWNYYVGEGTGMYAEDYHFEDSVSINTTSGTWSAAQIAVLFEAMKARITFHYATISGTDKGIRLVDLSEPIVANGQTKIYIYVNAGKNQVNEPNQVQGIETRWSLDLGVPVLCSDAANKVIGEVVNSQLGFYLKNAIPNSPGNPLVKPNTFILNPRQVRVNNTQFEPPLPGGLVICDGLTYFDFPTGTAEADPYPNRGQYKIHFDGNANEHCFNLTKLVNYCIDNRSVGDQIRTGCVITLPGLSSHRLLATYVQAARFQFESQIGLLTFQEHPSVFYYGRVFTFQEPGDPGDVVLDEM